MLIRLKRFLIVSAAATAVASGGFAQTQAPRDYPSKPILLIVPFAAGGAADVLMRALAPHLGRRLGGSVIIENKSGANGSIGTAHAANQAGDGYTLLATSNATLGANPAVYKKLAYDAEKDFSAIAPIGVMPAALVINKDLPARDFAELMTLMKSKTRNFSFGSPGVGNPSHLAGERFKRRLGVDMEHVPYRGGSEIMRDLISGNIQMAFSPLIECLPHIRAGSIRAIAGMRAVRSAHLPDLPTIVEVGVPGIDYVSWQGIHGPKNMPPGLVAFLNAEINAVVAQADVRDMLNRIVIEPFSMSPEEFRAFDAEERRKSVEVAAEANVRLD